MNQINTNSHQSPKVVVMLDIFNTFIDRRIILEGESLVKSGYQVFLVTSGDGIKPHHSQERGIEVYRFPKKNKKNSDTYIKEKIFSLLDDHLIKEKMKEKKYNNPLFNFFLNPDILAYKIRKKIPKIKIILRWAFEPLIYLCVFRLDLVIYYIKFFLFKIRKLDLDKEKKEECIDFIIKQIKPDILHAHDLPNLPIAHQIKNLTPSKLVYDAHEIYAYQYHKSDDIRQLMIETEAKHIDATDAVITVNQQCKEIMQKSYPHINIDIISNATSAPIDFNPKVKNRLWHDKFHLPDETKIMVFPGGINPIRNIDTLLYAMQHIPQHLHVCFITYRKDVPYYQALSNKLGLQNRVHFICEIHWDKVNDWLASADVGIMPYQAASLNAKLSSPNKLFEFMVAGLPIIGSSELVNVKAVIDTYQVGVYRFFREEESYIEAIMDMFDESKGGCERFVPQVLACRHYFMWKNEAPKLLTCYKKLFDEPVRCAV